MKPECIPQRSLSSMAPARCSFEVVGEIAPRSLQAEDSCRKPGILAWGPGSPFSLLFQILCCCCVHATATSKSNVMAGLVASLIGVIQGQKAGGGLGKESSREGSVKLRG